MKSTFVLFSLSGLPGMDAGGQSCGLFCALRPSLPCRRGGAGRFA